MHEELQRVHAVIRPMRPEDIDQIMEVETRAHRAPWSRQVFVEDLHRGWAHVDVLREDAGGPVVAFMNYWLVGDEVHVLNVATHPAAQRRGHAARLILHVLAFARGRGCRLLTLEVRRTNRPAMRLYRRHGFRPVGVRPRYYEDGEDAVVMLLDLVPPDAATP